MSVYDFIVVGSGPAGASVASRLASTATAPTVLLLEAGIANDAANSDILAERWTAVSRFPKSVENYTTVPQKSLNNRSIGCARGKVVGGSSAINMCAYTVGPRHDYERWAELVGDDSFGWENTTRIRKEKIEAFESVPREYADYAAPDMSVHGKHGAVGISLPRTWESPMVVQLDAAKESGLGFSLDVNSGNPLGLASVPSTARGGYRVTAAKAYLENSPTNLTIVTGTQATRVTLEGNRAVGVKVASGEYYHATKEVILSAGAVDTPKLLMLSGIGDSHELAKNGIEVAHDLPGVGKSLQDHLSVALCWRQKEDLVGWSEYLSNQSTARTARTQFLADGTGPLGVYFQGLTMGFFKADEVLRAEEFESLEEDVQRHLKEETVPLWEMSCHLPPCTPEALSAPEHHYLTVFVFLHNPQSLGNIALASAAADSAPLIDPKFFTHAFDRAVAIAATRRALDFINNPLISANIESPVNVPASGSDDDVLEFWRKSANSTWHPSCTVRMGRDEDEKACVQSDFKVKRLQSLRVVDLSVLPFLLNCHPMSVAYLVGEIAAEKIIREHGLDVCDT